VRRDVLVASQKFKSQLRKYRVFAGRRIQTTTRLEKSEIIMELSEVPPNIYTSKLENTIGNRKFLSKSFIDRLYSGREGLANRVMSKRKSLVNFQLRRGSKEDNSNQLQNGTAHLRKCFSVGNAYKLSQIDLEESGYLTVFSEENHTGTISEEHRLENHSIDEHGELQTQGYAKTMLNGKSNEISEEAIENGMNNVSKKLLTLSVSSSICSDESSVEGELTHDHQRLTAVLNSIDPKRLHNYLKRKLEQKDSSTIQALGTLLPKKRFRGETLHCVRCHKDYDPKHGEKSCVLHHQKDDVITISEDDNGADFACERCGSVFRIEGKWKYKESLNKKFNCGPCFSGVHTTSTDEVMQEENGISESCEDYGCIVFYV